MDLSANRTSATKTIVLVHGGGWTSGDKSDMDAFVSFINNQMPSYAAVNVNYGLADDNNPRYPMKVNDITTVINHLETNENYYTISDAIGFVGASARGHLFSLCSYAIDTDNQVKMVCSVVGPTNFTNLAYINNSISIPQNVLDTLGIDATSTYLETVNPHYNVTTSAPITILFYGGQDFLVPTT